MPRWGAVALVCALATLCPAVRAQDMGDMPMEYGGFDPGAPMTEMGEGGFFSQELGTLFRLRYNTESYGQEGTGNLDLGTMRVANFDDAIGFFDGQLTLNDEQGVGFNLGVGFRWMSWMPIPIEPERITGFSLWADGTSTSGGNFFPQVGVSYESLGDMWDLRVNSYIPIGKETQLGAFEPTGAIGFQSNFLSQITVADEFSSFNVGEVEVARRLGAERDAWAFASPYVLANDRQDTAGYKVGLRGYAYPDLLLQVAVSDDDIFKTNATFSMMWFVGRTRTNFQPACGLPDRMREPVMRNDYVALGTEQVFGGIPLTDTNGDTIRFVHVYSEAPDGGNGTFESPFNEISDPNGGGSQEGDHIFLWSQSQFNNNNGLVLKDNQFTWGEGDGVEFTIDTLEEGVVVVPETRPGSRDFARPIIFEAMGDVITLADTNEVTNLTIDGNGVTSRAIVAGTMGAGNPNLHDLAISDTTGDGIVLTPFVRDDEDDPDLMTVAFNVTIDEVVFDGIGGDDIAINAATSADVTDPNVTLLETINISNVTSQNGDGRGILLQNTHDNRTTTISNYLNGTNGTAGSGGGLASDGVLVFNSTMGETFEGNVALTNVDIFENTGFALDFTDIDANAAVNITNGNGLTYDGGAGNAGGLRFRNFDGTFTGNSSTIDDGTLQGVFIGPNGAEDSNGTFTFANTFTINSVDTADDNIAAFHIDGLARTTATNGTVTMNGTITNDTGRSLLIENLSDDALVTIAGNIEDDEVITSRGVLIRDNSDSQIIISGNLDIATTNITSIELSNNTGADISLNGVVTIDHDGTGDGFSATNGGMLTMLGTTNTIEFDGSGVNSALVLDDIDINTAGVRWETVNSLSALNGMVFSDLTGGAVTIGTVGNEAPESGLVTGSAGHAIIIEDAANVTITGVQVDGTSGFANVLINKTNAEDSIVNLNDMDLNEGDYGVRAVGGGTGELNLTINDTTVNDADVAGLSFEDVEDGTIAVNDVDIDGAGAAAGAAGVEIIDSEATFTFDGDTSITNVDGTAFHVMGGEATVTMSGDITNSSGNSIIVEAITGGNVTFASASSVTDMGEGIAIRNNTGGAVNVVGTNELDTTTFDAVTITGNSDDVDITLAELDITTTTGQGFVATGGGTLSVQGVDNTISTGNLAATDSALHIEDMVIGDVDFQSVSTTGGLNGIQLVDNETGTITIGDTGAAVGAGGVITGTADAGVHVTNSNVTLNGVTVQNFGDAAADNGVEIFHTNSTAMAANLNRLTVTNTTTTRDSVEIVGTAGDAALTANIQNLVVNVDGNGLDVQDDVTLGASGVNTITTETGVGLRVVDSAIAAGGATFRSVNVTAGTSNGIVLEDLTGGTVSVTGTGTTDASGGTLDTAGDAIVVSNAPNVSLNNIDVTNSANAVAVTKNTTGAMAVTLNNVDITGATADGINASVTASGAFDLTINDTSISGTSGEGFELTAGGTATDVDVVVDNMTSSENLLVTTSNNVALDYRLTNSMIDANTAMNIDSSGNFDLLVENSQLDSTAGITFDLDLGANAQDGDVIFRNNTTFEANDAAALEITSSGSNNNVDLLITANTFTNTSNASDTVDISVSGGAFMDANVTNNSFANSGSAFGYQMQSDGSTSRINLNIIGNNASSTGADDYELITSNQGVPTVGFNFGIVDRDDADANNVGSIDFNPAINEFEDIPGPVEMPVLP